MSRTQPKDLGPLGILQTNLPELQIEGVDLLRAGVTLSNDRAVWR